jgi:hypothetical protein
VNRRRVGAKFDHGDGSRDLQGDRVCAPHAVISRCHRVWDRPAHDDRLQSSHRSADMQKGHLLSNETPKDARLQAIKRMMGLEPTTFCMANARDRSHRFASVRSNLLFAATTGRANERQRTRANAECSHCSHCSHCDRRHAQFDRVLRLGRASPTRHGQRPCPHP